MYLIALLKLEITHIIRDNYNGESFHRLSNVQGDGDSYAFHCICPSQTNLVSQEAGMKTYGIPNDIIAMLTQSLLFWPSPS
ncbi:hypothetical protein EYZ11_000716 [Aspergillus tanneri]|uniref:Uncharacterized protein n=1 Tax=Aspergillus tanneri TaxID=1220188 RepID=A0A4S3JWD9_9EURO|nr:hypothetical protein EYZ11_000716 [Aspergillus tanneri]